MSNARTLANTINSSSQIVVPSGGVNFGTSTDGTGTVTSGVLDDYEEGTWTPDMQDSSGNTASTGNVDGTYVKIGRACLVTYNINNIITTGLTSADDVRIYGLPFTAASLTNNQHWTGAVSVTQMTFSGYLVSDLFDASSYFRFREVISGLGGDYLIVSQLTSGSSDFFGSFMYYTA